MDWCATRDATKQDLGDERQRGQDSAVAADNDISASTT